MNKNHNMDQENYQVLDDRSKSGKNRPWREKKRKSKTLVQSYADANMMKKAMRIDQCADYLEFKVDREKGLKLAKAYFCKVRLCPMCNWRRTLKLATENRRIVQEANRRYKLRWIFLTLTGGETVEGKDLEERIKHMMLSFNRLMKYKQVGAVVKGFFRGLEVTKSKGKYHPHFHVLIAVMPSYFNKGKYMSQEKWSELWQKALKADETPVVDVRAVRPNIKYRKSLVTSDVEQMEGAVQEISKYVVKDSDLVKGDRQTKAMTVHTLETALSHKRLIGYGGILKEIREELFNDRDDEDLIKIDEECQDEVANEVERVTAYWHYGIKDYVINEKKNWITRQKTTKD